MEPTFEEACKVLAPYFEAFSLKFTTELKENVFIGSEEDFTKAKHQMDLIRYMQQTIINETCEGVTQ